MTIHEGIPIGSLKPLEPPKAVLPTPKLPEFKEPSAEETAAGIARQNRVKAHMVFEVNGRVIGVHFQDGFTTFQSGFAAEAVNEAKAQAARLGYDGEAGADFVAQAITQALKTRFGSQVQARAYDAAQAPTRGEIFAQWFGAQERGNQVNLRG
ncbi:MAG: hypothetical protein AB7E49_08835 [Campylobacterales bacterium]